MVQTVTYSDTCAQVLVTVVNVANYVHSLNQ